MIVRVSVEQRSERLRFSPSIGKSRRDRERQNNSNNMDEFYLTLWTREHEKSPIPSIDEDSADFDTHSRVSCDPRRQAAIAIDPVRLNTSLLTSLRAD